MCRVSASVTGPADLDERPENLCDTSLRLNGTQPNRPVGFFLRAGALFLLPVYGIHIWAMVTAHAHACGRCNLMRNLNLNAASRSLADSDSHALAAHWKDHGRVSTLGTQLWLTIAIVIGRATYCMLAKWDDSPGFPAEEAGVRTTV